MKGKWHTKNLKKQIIDNKEITKNKMIKWISNLKSIKNLNINSYKGKKLEGINNDENWCIIYLIIVIVM